VPDLSVATLDIMLDEMPASQVDALLRGGIIPSDMAPPAPQTKEAAARAATESRRGSSYTDGEWSEAKRNLVAFFAVLNDWQRGADDASR